MTHSHPVRSTFVLISAAVVVMLQLAVAQTKITVPKNKYTPEQDVQLGREAAAEVAEAVPRHRPTRRSRAISIGSGNGSSRPPRPN